MNKTPYGTNGRMIFDRLWKALEIRGKNKQYLKDNGIHSNTVAKLTKNTPMFFGGIGKIFDCDGNVLAEAEVNYIKLPPNKIQENLHIDDEMVYQIDDGVTDIDIEKFEI